MLRCVTRAARHLTEESLEALKATALADWHVALGGKMVPFAGWYMPVMYDNMSIKESHLWCREHTGLFDVSHMGQLRWTGEDRYDFLESLSPGNFKDLKLGNARLTQLTNDQGGIMDDTMVTKKDGWTYQVVNAGCAEADIAHFESKLSVFEGDCAMEYLNSERSLLAIQGPTAVEVVQDLVDYDLAEQAFMANITGTFATVPGCFISRCGYTGEDGFEVSIPNDYVNIVADILVEHPEVEPIGLAARDTLRLEAGLCLMGSDMWDSMTPVEADLGWTIGKRRKEEMSFPGAEIIMDQLANGVQKKRVGFIMDSKRVARQHYPVFAMDGETEIGEVTSGTLSPILDQAIGMAFVDVEYAELGSQFLVDIRGKKLEATVSKTPFVEQNYYRKPKK